MSQAATFALVDLCRQSGAVAVGIMPLPAPSDTHQQIFEKWLEDGYHAGMRYMENHGAIRKNPRLLQEDAINVITLAYSYSQPLLRPTSLPLIAPYAYGKDYHRVLRKRLNEVKSFLSERGYSCRICIDSAPVAERWMAVESGIAEFCDNGMVSVPGFGQEVFLVEILTSAPLDKVAYIADGGEKINCSHCGLCREVCPIGGLQKEGIINCNRCINYLTIEHSGEFSDTHKALLAEASNKSQRDFWVGCDLCVRVCPLNKGRHKEGEASATFPEFYPSAQLLLLTREGFNALSPYEKETLLSGSALRRALK